MRSCTRVASLRRSDVSIYIYVSLVNNNLSWKTSQRTAGAMQYCKMSFHFYLQFGCKHYNTRGTNGFASIQFCAAPAIINPSILLSHFLSLLIPGTSATTYTEVAEKKEGKEENRGREGAARYEAIVVRWNPDGFLITLSPPLYMRSFTRAQYV